MLANASEALAVGLALCFLGIPGAVWLCRMALRQGAEFEAEITLTSFRLKTKPAGQAQKLEDDIETAGGLKEDEGSPLDNSRPEARRLKEKIDNAPVTRMDGRGFW